ADVVNFVLHQVVDHGTGTGAAFGKPAAGKTGTTEDYGDAWFVGYTPKLTAAVWMGYAQGQSKPMTDVHGIKVNGGSLPATVFSLVGVLRAAREAPQLDGRFDRVRARRVPRLGRDVHPVDEGEIIVGPGAVLTHPLHGRGG